MKKVLILFFIIISLGCGDISFAQSQFAPIISKMEKSVLGMNYSNQTDAERLSRLEKAIYGQSSNGSVSARVNKLSNDVNANEMGTEIAPKRDTFETPEDSIKEDIPKADKNVNYPSIDALEDKVFNKEFKNTDVNERLSNLEKSVFQKTYSDDLNSRVERLQGRIGTNRVASGEEYSNDDGNSNYYTYDNNNSNSYDNYGGNDNYSTGMAAPTDLAQVPNYYMAPQQQQSFNDNDNITSGGGFEDNGSFSSVKLTSIEKSVLKHSYPNDALNNRLARLETAMFGTIFNSDDTQSRIERIASAYKAEKSARKYDGNKLTQHLGTAMQLGTLLLMVLAFVL